MTQFHLSLLIVYIESFRNWGSRVGMLINPLWFTRGVIDLAKQCDRTFCFWMELRTKAFFSIYILKKLFSQTLWQDFPNAFTRRISLQLSNNFWCIEKCKLVIQGWDGMNKCYNKIIFYSRKIRIDLQTRIFYFREVRSSINSYFRPISLNKRIPKATIHRFRKILSDHLL